MKLIRLFMALCLTLLPVLVEAIDHDRSTDAAAKALDYRYEQALKSGNLELLQTLLTDEFVWIHNQAILVTTEYRTILNELPRSAYKQTITRHC